MSKPLSISDPRGPATVAAYVGYLLFGILVGPGPYVSVSVADAVPEWAENMWAYSMLAGGALFLIGAVIKRHLYWALTLQGAGSLASFFGLLTYGVSGVIRSGYPNGVPFLVIASSLAIASLIRGITCLRDSAKLTRVNDQSETVSVVAEPVHGDQ